MSRLVALSFSVLVVVGCSGEKTTMTFVVHETEYAAAPGSGEPNLFTTADGRVLMSWIEPIGDGHALRLAERSAGGWSEPMTVVAERDFFVNWADFPSIVETEDGRWIAHWLEKTARSPYAYHVMLVQSSDRGATWSEPVRAHVDESPTEHGFVSMVPLDEGETGILWLDGQNTGGGEGHRGAMQLRAGVISAAGPVTGERLIDDRICDCCQTAMTRTPGGLVAAYRDRSEEEIRDIAVSRFVDGEWSEPYHVGSDNWHFPACPVNGPALASAGDTVAIAWFAAPNEISAIRVAFSTDGGASFGTPIRIDDGDPLGRVDVELLDGETALVSWLERTNGAAEVRAKQVPRTGDAGPSWLVTSTSDARRSGFPRMTAYAGGVLFAWTLVGDEGGVRVARAEF